jgi:predicted Rossmann fold flavoprotein
MQAFDTIILGAGAAGLFCAAIAGGRGRRVLVIDHADQPGAKILISGGGRCNFTNRETAPERFFSANPNFCRSALRRYTQHDFLRLVEKHRIAWHEKTLGQLFCDGSAREILAMLLAECAAGGVQISAGTRITDVSRAESFRVETDRGAATAPSLVLATGGLSIPKLGATGLAHDLARRFGLAIVAPRPALVPLTAGAEDLALMRPISGVSLPVTARCGNRRFAEAMLFTHRGLSGPAILQVSSAWREGEAISLDLLPGQDAASLLRARKRDRPKAELKTVLAESLPQRLAQKLVETRLAELAGGPIGGLTDKALNKAGTLLNQFAFTPEGTEGYAKAEVTLGGIDTAGLSQQTMEARAVPGLFAIGEAVDVTGWLGGYNFQWAWSSGWAAGMAIEAAP